LVGLSYSHDYPVRGGDGTVIGANGYTEDNVDVAIPERGEDSGEPGMDRDREQSPGAADMVGDPVGI
jgi:hypothetical protein